MYRIRKYLISKFTIAVENSSQLTGLPILRNRSNRIGFFFFLGKRLSIILTVFFLFSTTLLYGRYSDDTFVDMYVSHARVAAMFWRRSNVRTRCGFFLFRFCATKPSTRISEVTPASDTESLNLMLHIVLKQSFV